MATCVDLGISSMAGLPDARCPVADALGLISPQSTCVSSEKFATLAGEEIYLFLIAQGELL